MKIQVVGTLYLSFKRAEPTSVTSETSSQVATNSHLVDTAMIEPDFYALATLYTDICTSRYTGRCYTLLKTFH